MEIATNHDESFNTCKFAINRIDNKDVLRKLAKDERSEYIKTAEYYEESIGHEERIIEGYTQKPIQLAAKKRLKELEN